MKTLEELKQIQDVEWHQHPNGGGWVSATATVAGTAYVGPDALIYGSAQVYGSALVFDNAQICGDALVCGDTLVCGDAKKPSNRAPVRPTKTRPDLLPRMSDFLDACLRTKPQHVSFRALFDEMYSTEIDAPKCAAIIAWLLVAGEGVSAKVERVIANAAICAGQAMAYGQQKYGGCTWITEGCQRNRRNHLASGIRHVCEHFADPSATEEGSHLPVLWHAICQFLIAKDCG